MRPRLRTLGVAVRLLLAGEISELCRRIRVSIFGYRAIARPGPADFNRSPRLVAPELPKSAGPYIPPGLDNAPAEPIPCLMFGHNLNLEGAPKSQFELTRALMERGVIAPEVIAFNDGPLHADYDNAGIPVTVVPSFLGRIPTLERLNGAIKENAKLIQEKRPGVVYANTLLTFVSVLAAHEVGVPSIWNPRESERWQTSFGFLNEAVARRAVAAIVLPYQVVFVADATRRLWSAFDDRGNFIVIPNALDPRNPAAGASASGRDAARRRLGYSDEEVIFLCVGTICPRKGQRDLVRAFGLLPSSLAAASRLCLVGNGDARNVNLLRSDFDRLPTERRERVALHRGTSEINDFFASADVFVLCSRSESCPRVILEAMAHELAVITTPVFGVREQLADGVSAIFFEPGDISTLAERMSLMIEDRDIRERLAHSARIRLDALPSFAAMIEAYSAVFRGASISGTRR